MSLLLNNLEINGFRGLSSLKLEKLGRVNLLVGRNSSGKTSVLEALQVLSSQGDPNVMLGLAHEHEEIIRGRESATRYEADFLENFFHGRSFPEYGQGISIGDSERLHIKIQAIPFIRTEVDIADQDLEHEPSVRTKWVRRIISIEDIRNYTSDGYPVFYALEATHTDHASGEASKFTLASQDIDNDTLIMRGRGPVSRRANSTPFGYVPTTFIDNETLSSSWDLVVLTERERKVIDMIKIIDNDVVDLAFVETDSVDRYRPRTARRPMARLSSSSRPISLGSLGDGVSRLFQIALTIVNCRHGFLLIDEFENGLHYSMQKQVWDFIFALSSEFDIQVFATTHSSDCIASFAESATNHPELGCAYHLGQSIIDGKAVVTRYEEDRLKDLVDMGRDIR
ncbi:MAG: AAA family ATPase [Halothiobacillaceae bacterium]|nr:MAG: AAA family ATPase [Halothiobacillaceae bacterium]